MWGKKYKTSHTAGHLELLNQFTQLEMYNTISDSMPKKLKNKGEWSLFDAIEEGGQIGLTYGSKMDAGVRLGILLSQTYGHREFLK